MFRDKFALVRTGLVLLTVIFLAASLAQPAQAQSYTVIHNFLGGPDGNEPAYGLAIDQFGVLYGSTFEGDEGTGNIYRLRFRNGFWQLNPLYVFTGGPNSPGAIPYAGVVLGPQQNVLYGTTAYGGEGNCATWGAPWAAAQLSSSSLRFPSA